MATRRHFLATAGAGAAMLATPSLVRAEISEDGLHIQPWITETFFEFGTDLEDAAAEGKHLMILVEQRGCPYCAELHEVNFQREEIVNFIQENFLVLQLNMWGSRATIDFDGEELGERELVQKWDVQYTPTTLLFDNANVGASTFAEAESLRLPGYLRPFHYVSTLEYLVEGAYKDQHFQRWLQAKVERLEEQGIHVDLWK